MAYLLPSRFPRMMTAEEALFGPGNLGKKLQKCQWNGFIGGGFKQFYVHPYLGKWSNFTSVFCGWVCLYSISWGDIHMVPLHGPGNSCIAPGRRCKTCIPESRQHAIREFRPPNHQDVPWTLSRSLCKIKSNVAVQPTKWLTRCSLTRISVSCGFEVGRFCEKKTMFFTLSCLEVFPSITRFPNASNLQGPLQPSQQRKGSI